jgi:hypothetical protein
VSQEGSDEALFWDAIAIGAGIPILHADPDFGTFLG